MQRRRFVRGRRGFAGGAGGGELHGALLSLEAVDAPAQLVPEAVLHFVHRGAVHRVGLADLIVVQPLDVLNLQVPELHRRRRAPVAHLPQHVAPRDDLVAERANGLGVGWKQRRNKKW